MLRGITIGCVTLGVTLGIGILFAKEETLSTLRFWSILGPILFAELLATISSVRTIGKTHTVHSPMLLVVILVPLGYFVLTLVMIPAFFANWSTTVLLTIQMLMLLAVLLLVVGMEMAGDSIQSHAKTFAVADASRQHFYLQLTGIEEILRSRFRDHSVLMSLTEKLVESSRYAADSVSGGESYDLDIETHITELENLATSSEVPEISTCIQQLLSSFRKREAALKTLR